MLRRNPTKIELKLDDLLELSTKLKGDPEGRRSGEKGSEATPSLETHKTRKEIIEERIGFNPRPRRPN
ncbi:hypothetical protein Pcinc_035446 [Petrolisthes cinctipes]|uniref:Uncharacterized protein n=1 Tax=Petrolisthes cinctipes TaxID=88211 RepID=A0AAE1BXS8_PETCI|nr:hypothetical protein Pcinc_035446 [Petrolisthes cinctipes]